MWGDAKDRERLLVLLVSRATQGLSEEELRVVDESIRGANERSRAVDDDLDLAAAAVNLAFDAAAGDDGQMPESLKQRILERAQPAGTPTPRRLLPKLGPSDARYLGWYAAAAILLLALWARWSPGTEPRTPVPTLAEQRALLIESAPDVIRVAWAKPEIPEYMQVTGDVVWSNQRQAGFMRLKGMPANRIAVEQYQLWIVDPSRDQHPIDGGVFDVPGGTDEVIIPIDAKIRVDDAKIFAITLEQQGGVVVSDGPLLVVAPA